MMKQDIKIHSVVDLITNSSTVIYTYNSSAVEPLKELVNEILKLIGEERDFDSLFSYTIEDKYDGDTLVLQSKDSKYDELCNKIINFLCSPEYNAYYDG